MKKKILVVGLAVSSILLSGCDDSVQRYGTTMNQAESGTMRAFHAQPVPDVTGISDIKTYLPYTHSAYFNRKDVPSGAVFFCEYQNYVKASEHTLKQWRNERKATFKTPGEIFQEIYGMTPEESCGVVSQKSVVASQNIADVKSDKATVETLRNLVSAVQECGRAKFDVLSKTQDLQSLTQAQAEEIITRCELYKLETELQGMLQ